MPALVAVTDPATIGPLFDGLLLTGSPVPRLQAAHTSTWHGQVNGAGGYGDWVADVHAPPAQNALAVPLLQIVA